MIGNRVSTGVTLFEQSRHLRCKGNLAWTSVTLLTIVVDLDGLAVERELDAPGVSSKAV